MATEFRAASNVVRHDNHSAPASLTERTFTKPANFLLIYNPSVSEVQVSFDGTNEFPIPSGAALSFELAHYKSYYTHGSGAEALKVLVGSEE